MTCLTSAPFDGWALHGNRRTGCRRIGGELKLLSPRGRLLDVLRVFRLLDVVPSFEDETNALHELGAKNYSTARQFESTIASGSSRDLEYSDCIIKTESRLSIQLRTNDSF